MFFLEKNSHQKDQNGQFQRFQEALFRTLNHQLKRLGVTNLFHLTGDFHDELYSFYPIEHF